MCPLITLKLLGAVDLLAPDGSSVSPVVTRPKTLAVLAYLATARPRGLHRRDAVISVFWPEKSQKRARRSLRQTSHFLRSALGHEVLVSRGKEEIGIDRGRVTADVFGLEDTIDRGDVDGALSLYDGDFMQGFFLRGAPDFEDWVAGEQVRLRRRLFAATSEAIRIAREDGRIEDALALAQRVAELRPGHEPSGRELMVLCLDAGDRAGAGRAYARLVKQLAEGFAVAPDPETQAVADLVKQAAPHRRREDPVRSGTPLAGHTEANAHPAQAAASLARIDPPSSPRSARPARLLAVATFASLAALAATASLNRRGGVSPEIPAASPFAAELVKSSEELDGPPLRTSRDAVVLLSEAIRVDTAHAPAYAHLALALSGQVQVGGASPELADSAEHLARRAIEKTPEEPVAWLSLANALGAQGRLGEADSAFQAGLSRDPLDASLHFGVGWYAFLRGDLDHSLRSFGSALESRPDAALAFAHIGAVWLLAGAEERANVWLAVALDRMPDHPGVLALRAASYAHARRRTEVRALVDTWVRRQPDNAEAFAVGARAALREGDWERAAELGRMGHLLQPGLRGAVGVTLESAYGYALLRLGRLEEAVPLLQSAIRSGQAAVARGDERPGVYFDVAAGYAALGDREASMRWLRDARTKGWLHHDLVPMGLSQFEELSGDEAFRAWKDEIEAELVRASRRVEAVTIATQTLEQLVLGSN